MYLLSYTGKRRTFAVLRMTEMCNGDGDFYSFSLSVGKQVKVAVPVNSSGKMFWRFFASLRMTFSDFSGKTIRVYGLRRPGDMVPR